MTVSTGIRARLTISYILVALLSVLLIGALSNGLLESMFRRYVRQTALNRNQSLAALISDLRKTDGTWDVDGLSNVGMNALDQGVILRVNDDAGGTVWDALTHNGGLCQSMIAHMAANMESRYPNWQGSYTETQYPLKSGFRDVGTVTIGYYGPFFLNDEDLSFINTLNRLLLLATAGALVLAVGAGFLMARGISSPLQAAVAATQRIAAGDMRVALPVKSRIREVDAMSAAVNSLALTLRSQEQLRRRLTADMSHELRTPLATLQSHLEALIDGVWKPDRQRLSALYEEILRVNRMVADMESLARVESGVPNLALREVDLGALARRISDNHEPAFHAKGVSLRCTGSGTGVMDADRMSQVVVNLLSNALEFTPPGGAVAVEVEGAPGSVTLRVTDTGCGIGAADLPFIFERFYRADESRSRATGGSGIGLAIVKAIVEAHGGTVRAESEPGKGAAFTVTLPAAGPGGVETV